MPALLALNARGVTCNDLTLRTRPSPRTAANTLAKIANGLCDNLLTCVVR